MRLFAFIPPPVGDGLDGKARGIGAVPDADVPAVFRDVVDPVWDRLADGVLGEIMDQDRVRLLAPGSTRVLEVANQFLFFVSTLMMGSLAATKACLCCSMCWNCASRSGCESFASRRRALTLSE